MAVDEMAWRGDSYPFRDRTTLLLERRRALLHTPDLEPVVEDPSVAPPSLKGAMRALVESRGAKVSDNEVKALHARVSDAMLEGLLVCGVRGEICYLNDKLCHMLGHSRDELIGRAAAQYFGALAARGRRAKRAGHRDRYETELSTQSGRAMVVEVCAEPIEAADGSEVGFFAVITDITARARALRQSESQVRLLSAQFMAAQELERQRIARELHDSIGQSLGGLKFVLETCEAQMTTAAPKSVATTLKGCCARIQSIVDEVRRISMNLRPSTLDDLGILPTLGWFTREFRGIYERLTLDVLVQVREDEIAVPVKTAVYRIVQEAFNNVVTHAGARNISLVLQRAGSRVELRIQDDGAGFDPAAFSKADDSGRGLGLASMRERAEVTGGRFSIKSERGRGTTVRVTWPRAMAQQAGK